MARGKRKSISQENQDNLAKPELSSPITAIVGMPNNPEKEDADLKSYLKTLIEILKHEREEKQKESEAFKEETRKALKELKELEESRNKEMKEWKREFKTEIDTIKKTLKEITLEVEHQKEKSGVTEASISNRLQEIEERILGAEDNIVNIDKTAREDAKNKKLLTQNVLEIQDTMRRPNLRIIGMQG